MFHFPLQACGKYIVVYRIPFKRFNARGCPIYYRSHSIKRGPSNKNNIRAVCPRCLYVSRLAQSLPIVQPPASNAASTSAVTLNAGKVPLSDTTKLQNVTLGGSRQKNMVTNTERSSTAKAVAMSSAADRDGIGIHGKQTSSIQSVLALKSKMDLINQSQRSRWADPDAMRISKPEVKQQGRLSSGNAMSKQFLMARIKTRLVSNIQNSGRFSFQNGLLNKVTKLGSIKRGLNEIDLE